MPVASSISTKRAGGVAANRASKGCSTRSPTPHPAISSRLRGNSQIKGGAYSGASRRAGCGSKVSAHTGPLASSEAAAKSAWCPRWTPSKLPMATAPEVKLWTDAARPLWMRIRALDRGVAMPRQTALLVLCVALPAAAADVRFDGSYRLRFNGDTNLSLDESGYPSGQRQWFEHRLRLTPKIVEIGEKGGAEIQASFDILSGEFAGDVASDFRGYGVTERSARNGFRAEGFDFRHLFAEVSTEMGLLEI